MTADQINRAIAEGHAAYATTVERHARTVRVLETRWNDHTLQAHIVHPLTANHWRTWVEINAFTVTIRLAEVTPKVAPRFSDYISGQYSALASNH